MIEKESKLHDESKTMDGVNVVAWWQSARAQSNSLASKLGSSVGDIESKIGLGTMPPLLSLDTWIALADTVSTASTCNRLAVT